MAENVILAQTTLSGFEWSENDGGYIAYLNPSPCVLTLGEEYRVVCDGAEQTLTASEEPDGAILLADDETHNPLSVCYLPGALIGAEDGLIAFITALEGDTHTIAIYHGEASGGNDHPDETVILPAGAQTFAPGVNGLGEPIYTTTFLEFELVRWRKYRVSWEGEETVLMAYPGPNGEVCLGNLFVTGSGENTGERFLIVYGDGYSNIATYEAGESREVAIWLTNEVGIVLQDYTGAERAYYDIDRLRVDTTDGNTVEYIHDSLVPETVEKTVELDFSVGPMTVTPGAGQAFSQVHIPVPKGLAPDNIAEGVDIAGIIGIFAASGGAKIAHGSFKAKSTTEKIYHNLDAWADIVVAYTEEQVGSGSLIGYLSMRTWLCNALGTSYGGIGFKSGQTSTVRSTGTAVWYDSVSFYPYSSFTYVVGKTYKWFAISGLN
jgi:hypothetical protein